MFRIEFLPSAARQFKKLDARSRRSIANRIDRLARNPRPAEYKLLKGRTGICRIRSGDFGHGGPGFPGGGADVGHDQAVVEGERGIVRRDGFRIGHVKGGATDTVGSQGIVRRGGWEPLIAF